MAAIPSPMRAILVLGLLGIASASCPWKLVASEAMNASTFGLLINEGITNRPDNMGAEHIILTGHSTLLRTKLSSTASPTSISKNLQLVTRNDQPIPLHLRMVPPLLYHHLGDPCVYGNQILVPVENQPFQNGSVFSYDITTLALTNMWFTPQHHIPWLAVDDNPNNAHAILYSSEFGNASTPVEVIHRYRLPAVGAALEPLPDVQLQQPLQAVQGCDFDRTATERGDAIFDKLYCTQNPPRPAVVSINLTDGSVTPEVGPIEPELEGIVFARWTASGLGRMHVQNGHPWSASNYSTLFHFDQVCDD